MTVSHMLFNRLLQDLPDGRLVTVQIGLYWTAVVVEVNGETRCGLAATVGDESRHYTNEPAIPRAGYLTEFPARGLAEFVHSASLTEVAIGLAAVNALLPRLTGQWTEIHAEEVIAHHGAGKNVAVVGHFPFVTRLRPRVGNLWVLEQNPREGDLPAGSAPEIIPQADVLAITAMTLLNRTFDGLMSLRRPDTLTLLIGPTTPLSPVLFDFGVNIISGAVVDDIDATLRGVAQGANFHQLHRLGVRLVSMTNENR
ncbi:MAG: hypothetical protein FD146_1125 [Anaerolineaceae bacterium]|nr:MAG: hypothetical protein FD146_1125 [Anaerolineaceae bacterium]